MAKSGMTPRMARRQGSLPPGKVTRSDSMNQGSFATRGGPVPGTVADAMCQGKGVRAGSIAPGKVPRVANSMHQ